MKQLLARFRYFVATLLFLLTTAMSSMGGMAFADSTSPTPWTGQGTSNGSLDTEQCSGDTPDPGTLLWVFTAAGADSATITINGQSHAMTQSGQGTYKYVQTGFDGNFASLSASATYTGTVNGNPQLTISHGCPAAPTTVPTQAPVVKTDECGTSNDVYTVPVVTGVVYKVGGNVVTGDVHTGGALSVTIHAYPASSAYTLSGDTEWTLTFTNEDCGCGCDTHTVTADVPQFKDVCGYDRDTYTIPTTEHVKYYVNGSMIATPAGTYHVTSVQTITVRAEADANYRLTNGPEWTFTFTDKDCKPCVKKVRVPHVKIHDICGTKDDSFTVPDKTGVTYKINGQVLGAGTYKASDYAVNGEITVEALAMPGFQLKGTVHSWTYHFTNEPCGNGGGEQNTPVTPATVVFTDICATINDTYTIPTTVGVTYMVNGVLTTAGTYPATGTVTVMAVADTGYVLNGSSNWSHSFTNEACAGSGGQVLGDSTVVFTPAPGKGAAAAAELANTGQNSLASAIVAFVIATSAVLVYAFSPRRQLGSN